MSGPTHTKTLVASLVTGIGPDAATMTATWRWATQIPAKPLREAVKRGPGAVAGRTTGALVKGPNMARGGVNSLFKNLQIN